MRKLRDQLLRSDRIVVVCGAGISTGAGLPDFKTLYEATPELKDALHSRSYKHHCSTLARFLTQFSSRAQPTRTHLFLRRLFNSGKLLRCYTMNLDGLEGLPKGAVRHVHGRIDDPARCGRKRLPAKLLRQLAKRDALVQYNRKHSCHIRPGFVLYGEEPKHLVEMQRDLVAADLILVLGTRLQVDPVASFVMAHRDKAIGINNESIDGIATIVSDCDKVCEQLLATRSRRERVDERAAALTRDLDD